MTDVFLSLTECLAEFLGPFPGPTLHSSVASLILHINTLRSLTTCLVLGRIFVSNSRPLLLHLMCASPPDLSL